MNFRKKNISLRSRKKKFPSKINKNRSRENKKRQLSLDFLFFFSFNRFNFTWKITLGGMKGDYTLKEKNRLKARRIQRKFLAALHGVNIKFMQIRWDYYEVTTGKQFLYCQFLILLYGQEEIDSFAISYRLCSASFSKNFNKLL